MPPVPTAHPDGEKIRALIKARDSGTYPVRRFARRIGRHEHSVWNLIQGRTAGTAFLRQVAAALGVNPSDISDMADDDGSDPQMKVPALDARKGPAAINDRAKRDYPLRVTKRMKGLQAVTLPDHRDTIPLAALRAYPGYAPPPPLTVVSVTVGDGTSDTDEAALRRHAALTYLRLRYAIMTSLGQLDRIDEAEQARLRGDPVRGTILQFRKECASLLRGTAGVW